MSRIPPALAHRLDRLARRAHAFHRHAHHPLCRRYRGEVVALGRRTRLCLGCTLAAAGLLLGLVLGALLAGAAQPLGGTALSQGGAAALAAGALLLLAVPLAVPVSPKAQPPSPRSEAPSPIAAVPAAERPPGAAPAWPKLLTRLAPAMAAGALLGQPLTAPSPARAAAAALAALAVAWGTLRYRRRGSDRSACLGCPEGPPGPRCPGFAPVVRRERALSRLAGRWIARTEWPPGR